MGQLLLGELLGNALQGNQIDSSLAEPVNTGSSIDFNSVLIILLLLLFIGGGIYFLNK